MFKKNNNKGFTLMEMLIVVAIIAILIAIAVPTFSSTLEKTREATDAANIRAAYTKAASISVMDNVSAYSKVVLTQTTDDWNNTELAATTIGGDSTATLGTIDWAAKDAEVYVVVAADGGVSFEEEEPTAGDEMKNADASTNNDGNT